MEALREGGRESVAGAGLVVYKSLLKMKCTLTKWSGHPAVDDQGVAGHVRSGIRTQPKHSVRGFFRPSDAAERDQLCETCFRGKGILRRNPFEDTVQHRSIKAAGYQGVDANSLSRVLLGGGLCEPKDACLGGGVKGVTGHSAKTINRGCVHDRTTAALM